jgi:hypothetical protein
METEGTVDRNILGRNREYGLSTGREGLVSKNLTYQLLVVVSFEDSRPTAVQTE